MTGKNSVLRSAGLFFRNYFRFKGRTSRYNYWAAALLNAAILALLIFLWILAMRYNWAHFDAYHQQRDPLAAVWVDILSYACIGFVLLTLIPSLSCAVRRLHDIGRRGTAALLLFIPVLNLLLAFLLLKKSSGPNQYGLPGQERPHVRRACGK